MKEATKTFVGRLNTASGAPCCWISPSRMTTITSPMVMASTWSWVT